jgi:hypothetical protein
MAVIRQFSFILLLFLGLFGAVEPARAWVNPGFESGNTAGWTSLFAWGPSLVYPPHVSVVTATAAPHTQGTICVAPSVCLSTAHTGNYAVELDSGRGDPNHGDGARITQSDVVPSSSCLTFWFAAVLSGHHYLNGETYNSDAYVQVDVLLGAAVIATERYSWFDNSGLLVDDGADPFGGPEPADPSTPMQWKHLPWTMFFFDMSPYVGQTVTLQFTAFSCDATGHGSWGYVDDVAWGSCPTLTPSPTASPTASVTPTGTPTYTATPTPSWTATVTPTATRTASPSPTASPSATPTRTATRTASPTPSATPTRSPTPSFSDSPTSTDTRTATSTLTASPTPTATRTGTPSSTQSATRTDTRTPTATPTPTATKTGTPSATQSATATGTYTATATPTASPTATPSSSPTPTFTASPTATRSASPTPTFTATPTYSATPSATASATFTPTFTATPTYSATRTATATFSVTPTFSITPTWSASPTITQTFTPYRPPSYVTIRIYNAAGEEVALVANNFKASQAVTGFQAPLSVVIPDIPGSLALFSLAGPGQTLSWDGVNSGGQKVAGGYYLAKAEITDEWGKITVYTAAITVLRQQVRVQVGVYNSAGELVQLLSGPSESTPTITDVSFSSGQLLESQDPAAPGKLVISYHGGSEQLSWDGRNFEGRLVEPGTYVIKVETLLSGQPALIITKSVAVLRPAFGEPLASAFIAPNPVAASDSAALIHLDGIDPALRVQARIYNLAGELVGWPDNSAQYDRISWDFRARGVSGGVYMVALETREGEFHRRVLKLSLLR